ncbi:amino acid transporter [Tothia fuscella]|uniref:Amino acid transporter n=1 Tax=Tothia fuscella TaxID=1048955 RepID=A0A9P4TVN6_9PEZI|nr:amino acid transporter [Tothia fuscella]
MAEAELKSSEVKEMNTKELSISSQEDGEQAAHHGTSYDARDMHRLGKKQQFQRNFKYLSMLGFTSTLMATWEAMLASAGLALVDGGTAGFFWTYLGSSIAFSTVIASMADMASMAPTTGGQYHWVSEFAPRSKQRFLSYIIGWTSALGWQCGVAASAYLVATILQGLIVLNNETYTAQRWHSTLIMMAVLLISGLFNTFGAKKLAMIEGVILFLHIIGFFAVVIPLWACGPSNSSKRVFTEFYNGGGWSSIGSAVIIAQLATVFSFIGKSPDAAAHMAEEVQDASKTVPRVMISSVVLNGVMGFITVIAFCYKLVDLDAALSSSTGYPFIEVFHGATGSKAGTTVMVLIIVLLLITTNISMLATASRQIFAFARDDGLPFSHVWQKVVKIGVEIPLNGIFVSMAIPVILALINIGSTAAFNSIVGLLIAAEFTSYLVSIGCILLKRLRNEPLPESRWSMGKFAIPVNLFAVVYSIFIFIMSFFPVSRAGLSLVSMNWSSLVYSVIMGFSVVMYFVSGRYKYKGPVVNIRRD